MPQEFDGVDILPRLTGKAAAIRRTQPMFWDFFEEQAVRLGDWKLWRNASGDRLFNIADDPSELTNVINLHPEKAKQLAAKLDDWVATLRPDATAGLLWDDSHWGYMLSGAPARVKPDPRYLVPYDDPKATPYPAPMSGRPAPHGKRPSAAVAPARPAADGAAFEFNTDGDFEGWDDRIRFVANPTVAKGFLTGQAESGQGKFENRSVNIDGLRAKRLVVRMKSGGTANRLTLRWGVAGSDRFDNVRLVNAFYKPGVWEEVIVDLSDNPNWVGRKITRMRISPCNRKDTFEVDWVRFK